MTSRTAQRRDDAKAPQQSSRRWLVPAIIIGVVAIAAVIAVAAAGGGSDKGAETPGLDQTQPVEASGAALPTFGGDTANDPAVGMTIPTRHGQVVRRHAGDHRAERLAADAHVRRPLVPALPARGADRQ